MSLRRPALAAAALAASVALGGCVGQDDSDPVGQDRTPQEVMELAKETLDETSGVRLRLSSDNLPDSTSSIVLVSAAGTAVHPASFEGTITGTQFGITADGSVIAIDGKVWIKLPALLGPDFTKVDPSDYGAPDPGQLIATKGGLSDLLVQTESLEEGKEIRGGANNDEIVTEYAGTLTADQVELLIPSVGGGTFGVRYQVDADGQLRRVEIIGEFYEGTAGTKYALTLDDYGADEDITAP